MKRLSGAPCTRVKMRVKVMRGEFSGGTVASLMNVVKEAAAEPALRKELVGQPTRIGRARPGVRQRCADLRQIGGIRCRLRRLGCAVRDGWHEHAHRPAHQRAVGTGLWRLDFTYDEAILMGRGLRGRFAATAMAAGVYGFLLAGAIRPARAALECFMLPKPGEGPSPEAQRKGFFDLRFVGTTADGRRIRTKVTGDRDPGYGSTGKMLGQAAACLALDVDKAATPGGFWTPATIFGDRLIQRLTAHSGLTFELVPDRKPGPRPVLRAGLLSGRCAVTGFLIRILK